MGKTTVIIPAAGTGSRMKSETPKQLQKINGKPMILWTIEAFINIVDEIIISVSEDIKEEIESITEHIKKKIVIGGKTRMDSVWNGIKASDKSHDKILVHDAARPLITKECIKECIKALDINKAVVVAIPCSSTIKKAKLSFVEKTIPREDIYLAQTPQGFKREEGILAFKKAYTSNSEFTDDASIMEYSNYKTKIIIGDAKNIKITTQDDMQLANLCLGTLRTNS